MLYDYELTGVTPLLVHADDVEASDALKNWRDDPANRELSVRGDDRSPPWTWITYLYSDGVSLTIPTANLMTALRKAGGQIILKKNTTFKSLSQQAISPTTEHMPILVKGKPIPWDKVQAIDGDFTEHMAAAKALGFRLFSKRAPIGQGGKHVRTRARFDEWKVRGTMNVSHQAITPEILQQLFDLAGTIAGLCDWRPGSPKSPGPFGTFTATLKRK